MSNYPDDFNSAAFDRHNSSPEEALPGDAASVYAAQEAYREIMESMAAIMNKHGLRHIGSLSDVADHVSDFLSEFVSSELSNLADEGFDLDVAGEKHDEFMKRVDAVVAGKVAV